MGGDASRHLPLVTASYSINNSHVSDMAAKGAKPAQGERFDVTLAPGDVFTQTFDSPGTVSYLAIGTQNPAGQIDVIAYGDFSLGVLPPERSVMSGDTISFTLTLTAADGIAPSVALSVSDLPDGVSASWSANPVVPTATSTLSITTSPTVTMGTYPLSVQSVGGGKTHAVPVTLTVVSASEVCGPLSADTFWGPTTTYVLGCDVTVEPGVTLTVLPGTVVKPQSYNLSLFVDGALVVSGTEGAPVVFTSYKDDEYGGDTNLDGRGSSPAKGNWKRIRINSGGRATFDHAIVRYAGLNNFAAIDNGGAALLLTATQVISNYSYGIYSSGAGAVTMTNVAASYNGITGAHFNGVASTSILSSTFSGNNGRGVEINGTTVTTPTIAGSTFMTNTTAGIYLGGAMPGAEIFGSTFRGNHAGIQTNDSISPTIGYNSIYSNTVWGLLNSSVGVTVTATNNWWGSASGPYQPTLNPTGTGNPLYGEVAFDPWLTSAP